MSKGLFRLQVDMSYRRSYLTGGHFLLDHMSIMRTCFMGGHVLQANTSSGGQVLQDKSCRTSLAGHILWEVMC